MALCTIGSGFKPLWFHTICNVIHQSHLMCNKQASSLIWWFKIIQNMSSFDIHKYIYYVMMHVGMVRECWRQWLYSYKIDNIDLIASLLYTLASVVQRLRFGLVRHRLWVQIPVSSQNFQCILWKLFDAQVAGIKFNQKILHNSKHEQFKMSSEMSPYIMIWCILECQMNVVEKDWISTQMLIFSLLVQHFILWHQWSRV